MDAGAVIIYLPRFDLPVYSRWLPVGYLSSCSHSFLHRLSPLHWQEDCKCYPDFFLALNSSKNRHGWKNLLLRRSKVAYIATLLCKKNLRNRWWIDGNVIAIDMSSMTIYFGRKQNGWPVWHFGEICQVDGDEKFPCSGPQSSESQFGDLDI